MVNAFFRCSAFLTWSNNYPVFQDVPEPEVLKGSLRARKGRESRCHGPVAQLGERLVCIQEVVGSNPVGSTTLPRPVAHPSEQV